jgi:hypothetical protein
MTLRIEQAEIRNLRNHPNQDVDELRRLLAAGVAARPDPRRKNFYEVDAAARVFYFHVAPGSARVMFLAVWQKAQPARREADEEAALAACSANS